MDLLLSVPNCSRIVAKLTQELLCQTQSIQLALWGNIDIELLYQGKLRLRQVYRNRNSKLSHHITWVTCPAADLVKKMSFVERCRACPFGSIPSKELEEERTQFQRKTAAAAAAAATKQEEYWSELLRKDRKEGWHWHFLFSARKIHHHSIRQLTTVVMRKKLLGKEGFKATLTYDYDYDNQQNQNPTPYNNMYLPLNGHLYLYQMWILWLCMYGSVVSVVLLLVVTLGMLFPVMLLTAQATC